MTQWLRTVLRRGDRVGADASLIGADQWLEWKSDLGINIEQTILKLGLYLTVNYWVTLQL